jgi:molybdenum cofactor cytidylyltransferase
VVSRRDDMRIQQLSGDQVTADAVVGRVLTHDVGHRMRKGMFIGPEHVEALQRLPEVHVLELDPGDVHEDAAARRLGAAVAGPGTEVQDPVQSQVRLIAQRRGLVRVDRAAVDRLNLLPAMSLFTLVDGQAIDEGSEVAGAKITPVAVAGSVLAQAERLARERGPVVKVDAFRPLRTKVVVTERLKPKARELFSRAVTRKLGWYGAQMLPVREVERSSDAVRGAYMEALHEEADLVLFAGASSIDPLDAAYAELAAAGGELLRQGVPAHPGSMLWLGRLGRATVLGVASCAGFGKNTSLDLLLPFVFAYGEARETDFQSLGYGGLIEEGAGRRFPPYPDWD